MQFTYQRGLAETLRTAVAGKFLREADRPPGGHRTCDSCRASLQCRRGTPGRNIPRATAQRPAVAAVSGRVVAGHVRRTVTISPCRTTMDHRCRSSGEKAHYCRLWCPSHPCWNHPRCFDAVATDPAARSMTSCPCSGCRSSAISQEGEAISEDDK